MSLPRFALAALALVTVIPPGVARAGAWVQPRDGYYFKLSVASLDTGRELNADGEEVDILAGDTFLNDADYRDLTISAYVEYGLTDRFTVLGTLPFRVLSSKWTQTIEGAELERDIDATNGGLGDLSLGVRYPLLRTPAPVSVQGGLRIPLGYDSSPDNGGPPLGSGRVDVEGWLLAGASLYPLPGYLTGGVGYRVRGGDVDDEFLFSAEGGVSWRRLMARVAIDGLYSTTAPPDLSAASGGRMSSSVVVTEQDILKLTPAVGLGLSDEISIVVEAFHVIDGKNTVTGTTWAAGIVFQQ